MNNSINYTQDSQVARTCATCKHLRRKEGYCEILEMDWIQSAESCSGHEFADSTFDLSLREQS